jgi:thiamine pyrophosphate-dependent acetolactate synthase large subunit-like protein
MKVADGIAQALKAEGVEYVIGYPVNPMFEAAAKVDIRTIIVRQERVGLHMADAISRLTSGKKIGVFAMQNGPGAENAFGGVAQAYSESVPILVLPVGYHRKVMGYFPNFNSTQNYQNITKTAENLSMGKFLPDVMRRAFTQLKTGRPGPVLIEIPGDVFGEDVPEWWKPEPARHVRTAPDPKDVDEVAEVLANAENPVIYIGQGVHYAEAWAEIKELAEKWNIPVTTSIEGKSAFPENHPLYLGCGGRSMPKAVRHYLDNSDVIFGIGCSYAWTPFGVGMPRGKTMIHATLDPADLNKDIQVDYALLGDAKLTLQMLLEAMADRNTSKADARKDSVPAGIKAMKAEWLADWMPKLTKKEGPINPYRVIWEMMNNLDVKNTIITHDAGSPRDQLTPFWESTEPLSYIGWGKTTQLGYGLGLAMGAKLVHPEKLCINVWGDAAIGMTGMDFETAVRNNIPILSIMFNNFSMAIEIPIMQVSTEKYRSTDISGNYSEMAKAFGGFGERITDPAEIVPALKRGVEATQNGQPAMLEFITDKEIETSTF